MARKSTASRKPATADLKLRKHIQDLTPELFNMIREYYFLCVGVPRIVNVQTSKTTKPPGHLAVDRASRQQAIDNYYGQKRIFDIQLLRPLKAPNGRTLPQIPTTNRLLRWLNSLTPAAKARINCIRLEAPADVEEHFTAKIDDHGHIVPAETSLVVGLKYDFLQKLERRMRQLVPALREGVLRLKLEHNDEVHGSLSGWVNKGQLSWAWDSQDYETWAEFFEALHQMDGYA